MHGSGPTHIVRCHYEYERTNRRVASKVHNYWTNQIIRFSSANFTRSDQQASNNRAWRGEMADTDTRYKIQTRRKQAKETD